MAYIIYFAVIIAAYFVVVIDSFRLKFDGLHRAFVRKGYVHVDVVSPSVAPTPSAPISTAVVHVDYIRIIEACHAWGLAVTHSAPHGGSTTTSPPVTMILRQQLAYLYVRVHAAPDKRLRPHRLHVHHVDSGPLQGLRIHGFTSLGGSTSPRLCVRKLTLMTFESSVKIFDTIDMTFESSVKIFDTIVMTFESSVKIFDTIVMTFESSIKIFDVAITKIFNFADMVFDAAIKIFRKFDLCVARKFDPGVSASQEIRPRHLKKFEPGVPRNFDPCVSGDSTPASQEIRPLRLKSFDPCVSGNSTPALP
jgi:hypothetical protein